MSAAKRGTSARSKASTTSTAKAKADAAARRARQNGATGARLTAAKQQLRDSLIIARAAQGLGPDAIAAEAGVTRRTVERVIAARRGIRSPLEDAPMKLLEDLAVGFRLSIGDFEAMALAWFDTNQTAALGAKKAADETRMRLATLLADVGKLPQDLELFRSETAMQRIAERMVEVLRAVADGEMSAVDALDYFRSLVGQQPAEEPAQIASA